MGNQESELKALLAEQGIKPAEKLGQNFLVDEVAINRVVQEVILGGNVIEIGSGSGTLTERVAQQAGRVIGIEIDTRFREILTQRLSGHSNVEIVFADALSVDIRSLIASDPRGQWQIIANLPFHISEPFLKRIAGLPIENAVLILGDKLASTLQITNPQNWSYSKLSMLGDTFFYLNEVARLSKASSYPSPRIDLAVVFLTPRDEQEIRLNPRLAIQRKLFQTEDEHLTVEKVLKEAVIDAESERGSATLSKRERNRTNRRKGRQELRNYTNRFNNGKPDAEEKISQQDVIESLGLQRNLLSTPFSRLDNSAIRTIAEALKRRYG